MSAYVYVYRNGADGVFHDHHECWRASEHALADCKCPDTGAWSHDGHGNPCGGLVREYLPKTSSRVLAIALRRLTCDACGLSFDDER